MALSIPTAFQKRAYRRSLVPHIDACLGNRINGFIDIQDISEDCQTMAGVFVIVYREAGRQHNVVQITERVTLVNTEIFGKNHHETLVWGLGLVNSYRETGRRQAALILANHASVNENFGDGNAETLNALHCLTLEYFLVGLRHEALHLQEQLVEARRRVIEVEYLNTLDSMSQLAS